MKSRKGFTLLELMLVIAIIVSLLSIIIFIVRPADVLNNTKATKRSADKESIEKGLDAYISKQAVIPSSLMSLGEGQYDICRMGQTNCTANSVSLDELVSSGYLETIPFDPDC